MPRNISFALTTKQFRAKTKDVTRRMGWQNLKAGDVLNACVKCMGLKPGEKIKRLGQIQDVSVTREKLNRMTKEPEYGRDEVIREGFPDMTPAEFVAMFCKSHKGCKPSTVITRIEYRYLD